MYHYKTFPRKFMKELTFEQVKRKTLSLFDEDDFDEEAFYRALEKMEN